MTRRLRGIATALLVSALAHAIVMSGVAIDIPAPQQSDLRPLQARLEARPAAPAVAAPPAHAPQRPRPAVHAAAAAAVAAAAADAGPERAAAAPEPTPGAERDIPDVVASAAAGATAPDTPPLRTLPRRGRIAFELYYGADRAVVGRVVQTWEAGADRYVLTSEARTTGLVDVFRPQHWRYESRGAITPRGLRPDAFAMDRTRRGRQETARAEFDWTGGTLAFGNPQPSRSAPLRDGAQDLISMIFQLAVAPPGPGRIAIPVTTGSRYEQYEFEVLPEEMLETPLGPLRTVPVRQIRRPGEDGIDIWLAAEYRYLPVRLRFVDRDGAPAGEQVAAEIQVSDR